MSVNHESFASDPVAPWSSRFPLFSPSGPVPADPAVPSGPETRPYGLKFAVPAPVFECGKHGKKPTRAKKTEPTKISKGDNKEGGYKTDTYEYVEMDEV